ncbi:SbcC/MukB-like Walker B domain-containing protein [uncultured Sphaerochaeta sp.]|uniref:ATP-binding protein n=1 Tax=uncultured Sphaerochaeta sp. TaxID=886478 RepID=UPI002A0A8BAA|nr:SbcC/MukB-like Walker B domain-containing protein [uncultured Sphaerochaeta sp.]
MLEGMLEFAEDNSNAGFRCKRIEIYNWGTFSDNVIMLHLDGKNGLLTGDIGSGKSTLVDAITTLLVPSNKIAYNKAAGADFRERSLRSYVLGYYKTERSDGGFSTKPVALREPGSTHSVLLGVFRNEDYDQNITLAQVFFQKDSNGQPQRFFVVADAELSIKADFSDFGKDFSNLKRILKTRKELQVFESFQEYGATFQRKLGLKNKQALDLFHQTVSLKTVGNLTNFVQAHMLEPFDAQSHIDRLINHYEDLNQAHESIVKAKKQIQTLTPLIDDLDKYGKINEKVLQKTEYRDYLTFYFASIKKQLLCERITKDDAEHLRINQKITSKTQTMKTLENDRDRIRQLIFDQGGNQIETLKREISTQEQEKLRRQGLAEKYNRLARILEFDTRNNSDQFSYNLQRAGQQIKTVTEDKNKLETEKVEQGYQFRNKKDEYDTLLTELSSLHARKSNIDIHQIQIRDQLCKELQIDQNSLPFAGELIAVKPEEAQWEGAIERVIRSFALSLLVPDNLYSTISEWVDATHLKGRLVYYRMDKIRSNSQPIIERTSLAEKIEFKHNHPYSDWVRHQVVDRYKDFVCCESLIQLRSVKKGLTKNGQVKGSYIHHEKDDRFVIGDRRRYVLGWVNTAKIAILEQQKATLQEELQQRAATLSELQSKQTSLENQIETLRSFCHYDRFDDIDWQSLSNMIEEKKQEICILEEKSDVLHTLQENLASKQSEIAQIQSQLSEFQQSLGAVQNKLEKSRKDLELEEQTLQMCPVPLPTVTKNIDPIFAEYVGKKKLYYENCVSVEREFREKLQGEIDNNKKKLERLQSNIISAMEKFRHEYPAETREIDASVESGDEYRALLNALEKENLPKFENKFKVLLNQNTIREIAAFQAILGKENQLIKERIEFINNSMHEINYNEGRYIRLEAIPTNDLEIRTFKKDLKDCIEGSLGGTESQQYSEHKFFLVKKLIDKFKGREGNTDIDRKWTNKVTDVRNWFVFAASERWKQNDEEYEHYTDSGGKSGGQKEKLAYTVLAASLAYQFGLEWKEVRSRSFRFVVIDEAFGRGSDESARYGLNLFKELDLQLLIVTPLQKIHIIEPYVSSVGFVHNPEGKQSLLRSLTIKQYREEKNKHDKAVSENK